MNDAVSPSRYQLAEIGALLAEPARAAMLLALIDGTARPAGELAASGSSLKSTAESSCCSVCHVSTTFMSVPKLLVGAYGQRFPTTYVRDVVTPSVFRWPTSRASPTLHMGRAHAPTPRRRAPRLRICAAPALAGCDERAL